MNNIDPSKSKLIPYYSHYLSEEEMKLYVQYFSQDLPAAFRVNKHGKSDAFQANMQQLLETYFRSRLEDQTQMEKLPHVPGGYLFIPSRIQLRSNEKLNKIHKFLVVANEGGLVTRQEFVSMLPPLFLNCSKGEKVLDMCAAPGSKTSQLMEQVGMTGLVVANDLELTRCHVLMHGVISQPCPQLIITNLDASKYPKLTVFDKILCDVPCSGDGTLRKAKEIWNKWSNAGSLCLFEIQLKVLIRGLQLLKVGGEICYSTCSLNVIENEAVVKTVLEKFGASIEVIDCSGKFEGIKRADGLRTWDIGGLNGEFYKNYEEIEAVQDETYRKRFNKAMFPTQDAGIQEQLTKSMRFYPWLNNSGGFYVCMIKKVAELPQDDLADSLNANAMNYEKLNENTEFCMNFSKSMPLQPLKKIKKQEVVAALQEKFHFRYFFEEGDLNDILPNCAQRELQDMEATRVYLLNKEAQKILYCSENAYLTYHIVQAGCGGFERHTGIINQDKLSYRVETPMNFLLNNTDFVMHISYKLFLRVVRAGLNGDDESIRFQDQENIEQFGEDIEHLKTMQLHQMYLLKVKSEGLNEEDTIKVKAINELNISSWLGGTSLGFHIKRKQRNALWCLLMNEDIHEIVVSGEAKRKAAYRERRKNDKNGKDAGSKDDKSEQQDVQEEKNE
ncbi:Sun/nucleolar_protein family protein [Hexamita inflata]|uniref:Sun/nucleolar protein family protein n=1 Tax=Hexamita inflata TaxID=28002 RepID=A0AA86V3X8_9EUKA|nr:Sun/nucleolar protein family protein [Hexamita inflata]